jgi:hypothetical protein
MGLLVVFAKIVPSTNLAFALVRIFVAFMNLERRIRELVGGFPLLLMLVVNFSERRERV